MLLIPFYAGAAFSIFSILHKGVHVVMLVDGALCGMSMSRVGFKSTILNGKRNSVFSKECSFS